MGAAQPGFAEVEADKGSSVLFGFDEEMISGRDIQNMRIRSARWLGEVVS